MKAYHAFVTAALLFCAPVGCQIGAGQNCTSGADAAQSPVVAEQLGCVTAIGDREPGDTAAACGGNGNACTVCGEGADCRAGFCCDISACPDSACAGKMPGDACAGGECGSDGSCQAKNVLPACSGKSPGDVCGGAKGDAIHGECNSSGTCEWAEWSCVNGEVGDSCQGGICAAPSGDGTSNFCCSWGCVGLDLECHAVPGTWGGEPCNGQGGVP